MPVDFSDSGRRLGFTTYAPLFLWIIVIFYLSSSNGSLTQTSRFVAPLLQFLIPHASVETLQTLHGLIRKAAHFTEYAILALLVCRALISRSWNAWPLASIATVFVVACLDELNQSFNESRTGSPLDIVLDVSGGASTVVCLYLLKRRRNKPINPSSPA